MRSLLLKENLYRQTLAGHKTETRRTHNLNDINRTPDQWYVREFFTAGKKAYAQLHRINEKKVKIIPARFHLDEVLYLAEPHWLPTHQGGVMQLRPIYYHYDVAGNIRLTQWLKRYYKKLSPLFLPQVHAREFVRITAIKLERLYQITGAGVLAEGIGQPVNEEPGFRWENLQQLAFEQTWVAINGAESWKKNPWVWVYQYEYLKDKSRR